MIYLAGRQVREIYLGDRPIASVYLGGVPIWQSRVCMEAGAVIVLTSDAMLRLADGVSYTVESVVGSIALAEANAVPGSDANNGAVWAVPVVAAPYMRHIAPTQSVTPYVPLAETMPVTAPSEQGGIADIGGPIQAATITPGRVVDEDADARHIGTGIQSSDPVAGHGGILRDADIGVYLQMSEVTGGSGAVKRNMGISGGVHASGAITGSGETTAQSHTGGGVYRAKPTEADGRPEAAGAVAGGVHSADGGTSDGRLYSALAFAGAVPELKSMNADTDRVSVIANNSGLLPDMEPGYAGILPSSCDYQTPTVTAELQRSYAGIIPAACDYQTPTAAAEILGSPVGCRDGKTAEAALHSCAEAAPVGAAGAPGAAFPTAGAICTAYMITRVYINPAEIAFDDALVTEMDILTMAEIDQMVMKN